MKNGCSATTALQPPLRADADLLYDSSAVPHGTRWDLPLPSRAGTLLYLHQVQERVLDRLDRSPSAATLYFVMLAVFHEDMHGEAFLYTRQTLGYPRPRLTPPVNRTANLKDRGQPCPQSGGSWPGDVMIEGATFLAGGNAR